MTTFGGDGGAPCLVPCLSASCTHPLVSLCFSEPLCVSFASFHTRVTLLEEIFMFIRSKRAPSSRWAFESLKTLAGQCDKLRYSWWAGGSGVPQHRGRNKPTPMWLWVEETLKTMSHPPQRGRRHVWKSEGMRRWADSGRWRNNGCLISCRDAHIRPNWILITSYSLTHCLSFCVLQYPSSNQPSSAIFSEISFTHSY